MTVRINKQKINLREKLTEFEDKVNFDEVVRGLGENTAPLILNKDGGNVGIGTTNPGGLLHIAPRNNVDSNGDPTNESYFKVFDNAASGLSQGRNGGVVYIDANYYTSTSDVLHVLGRGESKFVIKGNGNVGIGTTNPGSARLAINPSSSDKIIVTRSFSTDAQYHHLFQNSSGTTVGNILVSTTGTSYVQNSDYRLKENVVPIDDAISRVKQLKPSRFNFIIDADNTVDGFLAHEVQEVVPQAITGEKDAVNADGDPEYQGIDQSKLVPLLTAAIQEQQQIIEDLKSRIETLESK